jgi:DNA-binding MarR family transcriptional regulator
MTENKLYARHRENKPSGVVILFLNKRAKLSIMSLKIKSTRARGLSAARIISRILNLSQTPKLQSELLEEILITRSTLSRYLAFLHEQDLLERVEFEGKIRLKTTARGRDYLKTRTLKPKNSLSPENGAIDDENHEDKNNENQEEGSTSSDQEDVYSARES